MTENYQGRKVLITGAAGVFGGELTCAFADTGAFLCLSDLRADGLSSLAEELASKAVPVLTHVTDLTNEESIRELISTVTLEWQTPDIVINNAGIYPFGGILEVDTSCWDRVMAVNLRAPFLIMQGFAKSMIAHGVRGCFINISSGGALAAQPVSVLICMGPQEIL